MARFPPARRWPRQHGCMSWATWPHDVLGNMARCPRQRGQTKPWATWPDFHRPEHGLGIRPKKISSATWPSYILGNMARCPMARTCPRHQAKYPRQHGHQKSWAATWPAVWQHGHHMSWATWPLPSNHIFSDVMLPSSRIFSDVQCSKREGVPDHVVTRGIRIVVELPVGRS